MTKFINTRTVALVAFGLLAATLLAPDLLLAATGAPETVAQSVSENTKVTWAWGEAANTIASAAFTLISSIALYYFRQLPQNVIAIIGNARVETLLQNAKLYGLNAVKDATADKTLSVDVGNKVLAEALQYALTNGSSWLLNWGGGADGIAKKLWARLNLDPSADASAVPAITAAAVATTSAT